MAFSRSRYRIEAVSKNRRKRPPLRAVEALFHGALERPAGDARSRWLTNATGGDTGLIEEVETLLDAHGKSTEFMESGPLTADPSELTKERGVESDQGAPLDAEIGRQIGPYKLVESLGEGGFGAVFRAEQIEPVRREVALKIIKLGMDTRQVIARFEAERQALAVLDHPSIARVIDAGATQNGRPYFVMDLVSGVDLTEFCDEERLTVAERCRVFLDLCAAVGHAHQRGIIHRDLKPSNVLATRADGRVRVKVIDFGIAKATHPGAEQSETLHTAMGQVIGTPVYMSPEQALAGDDIDTRTDVWALGVILYELLAGTTPITAEEFARMARRGELGAYFDHADIPAPSTRIAPGARDDLESIAAARAASPQGLRSAVRGDLDAIVLRALEPNKDRRYDSPASLARDVRKHLENRPIEASPPGLIYRSKKYFRRHRITTSAGAVVTTAILAGGAVSIDALRARRDQAEVLSGVFNTATVSRAAEDIGVTAAELEEQATHAFGDSDPIIVDALSTHANRLERAGALEVALDARRRALARAVRVHGSASPEALLAGREIGLALARLGESEEAKVHLARAIALDTQLAPPGTPYLNAARLELASLLADEGDLDRAEALASAADSIALSFAPRDRRMRENALRALVQLRRRAGDDDGARNAWRRLCAVLESLVSTSSNVLAQERIRFGRWLASGGHTREAAAVLSDALATLRDLDVSFPELELEALESFNGVAVDAAAAKIVEPTRLGPELRRELELARQLFDPGSASHAEALRRIADQHESRGEIGRCIATSIELYRALEQTMAESDERGARLAALANRLGTLSGLARTTEGLASEAYQRAREAVQIALEHEPANTHFMIAQIELEVRYGRAVRLFAQIEALKEAADIVSDHPLFLALEAVAYAQSQASFTSAEKRLELAKELESQFLGTPNLSETIAWASKEVEAAKDAFNARRGEDEDR